MELIGGRCQQCNLNIDLSWCRFVGCACWYEKGKCRYTAMRILSGLAMNLTDATLILLLAARIHGTDEAVRASAKSVVKKLPRSKRLVCRSRIQKKATQMSGFFCAWKMHWRLDALR